MEWLTTSTILRDLGASDDSDAWTRLVQRFHGPIVAFALRMGHSAQDAEDVAQETLAVFVHSFRRGKYDRKRGRLSKWLFGIAYRVSCKLRTARSRKPETAALDEQAISDDHRLPRQSANEVWDREWEQAMMAEVLRQVRAEVEPQTFRIFEMVVLEGRSAAEVARELRLPSTVVYNSKHRVITRCRRWRAMLEQVRERDV